LWDETLGVGTVSHKQQMEREGKKGIWDKKGERVDWVKEPFGEKVAMKERGYSFNPCRRVGKKGTAGDRTR